MASLAGCLANTATSCSSYRLLFSLTAYGLCFKLTPRKLKVQLPPLSSIEDTEYVTLTFKGAVVAPFFAAVAGNANTTVALAPGERFVTADGEERSADEPRVVPCVVTCAVSRAMLPLFVMVTSATKLPWLSRASGACTDPEILTLGRAIVNTVP